MTSALVVCGILIWLATAAGLLRSVLLSAAGSRPAQHVNAGESTLVRMQQAPEGRFEGTRPIASGSYNGLAWRQQVNCVNSRTWVQSPECPLSINLPKRF